MYSFQTTSSWLMTEISTFPHPINNWLSNCKVMVSEVDPSIFVWLPTLASICCSVFCKVVMWADLCLSVNSFIFWFYSLIIRSIKSSLICFMPLISSKCLCLSWESLIWLACCKSVNYFVSLSFCMLYCKSISSSLRFKSSKFFSNALLRSTCILSFVFVSRSWLVIEVISF